MLVRKLEAFNAKIQTGTTSILVIALLNLAFHLQHVHVDHHAEQEVALKEVALKEVALIVKIQMEIAIMTVALNFFI